MKLLTWNDSFSVHIEEFDTHHKNVVRFLNDLFDAVTKKQGSLVIAPVLVELIAYKNYHFEAEEKLMTRYSFPGYLKHKAEHDLLTSKINDFQKKYKEGKAMIDLELLNFLKEWLTKHIMETDKRYSSFLREKGVS